jgi:heptosyltransferase-2
VELEKSGKKNSQRRILIRGVNWLGDAVMALPALQRLREALPEAELTILVQEKLSPLFVGDPRFKTVETFRPKEGVFAIGRRLRQKKFDTALILPNSPRSALEMFIAGIPERIGFARPWRRWLLTHPVAARHQRKAMRKLSTLEVESRIAKNPERGASLYVSPGNASDHQIHDYLKLASVLGANPAPVAPRLFLSEQEKTEARKFISSRLPGSANQLIVGINPGAEYGPAKRWPVEKFAATVREFNKRGMLARWVLFGGESDRVTCEAIERLAGFPMLNLAGETTLRQLVGLLSQCQVLVTNDTGPMHVAAAVGTPVVVPYGSTSPALTGPGLPGEAAHQLIVAQVGCSPCFRRTCPIDFRCMNAITPDHVIVGIKSALEISGSPKQL